MPIPQDKHKSTIFYFWSVQSNIYTGKKIIFLKVLVYNIQCASTFGQSFRERKFQREKVDLFLGPTYGRCVSELEASLVPSPPALSPGNGGFLALPSLVFNFGGESVPCLVLPVFGSLVPF